MEMYSEIYSARIQENVFADECASTKPLVRKGYVFGHNIVN